MKELGIAQGQTVYLEAVNSTAWGEQPAIELVLRRLGERHDPAMDTYAQSLRDRTAGATPTFTPPPPPPVPDDWLELEVLDEDGTPLTFYGAGSEGGSHDSTIRWTVQRPRGHLIKIRLVPTSTISSAGLVEIAAAA